MIDQGGADVTLVEQWETTFDGMPAYEGHWTAVYFGAYEYTLFSLGVEHEGKLYFVFQGNMPDFSGEPYDEDFGRQLCHTLELL